MKIQRDYNYPFTFNNPPITPEEFDEIIKKHIPDPIVYCIFRKELGEKTKIPHFQGYIELARKMSYKSINKLIFKDFPFKKENETNPWLSFEPRYGTQSEAINYFTNENKEGYLPEEKTFESGEKKIDYALNNRKNNPRIPTTEEQQWVYIWKEMVSGKYKNPEDVRKDFDYLSISHKSRIREMLYDANPIDSIRIKQLLVICVSGESGFGKSTLNNLLSKQLGYNGTQVYRFAASLVRNSNSPFFNGLREIHKVCIVEEMDDSTLTSHYQFWVSLIDRNKPLNTKGGYMRNPFEIVIFNSIKPLYELIAKSWKIDGIDSIAKQILRRCCDPIIGSYFINIPDHIGNLKRIEEKRKILIQAKIRGEVIFDDPYERAEWYFKDVVRDELRNPEVIFANYEFAKQIEKNISRENGET